MKGNNFLIFWLSGMAFLSNVAGAATLANVLPERVVAFVVIINGGLQAATAAYVAAAKPVKSPVVTIPAEGTHY